ncbi:MAG: sialate O-acetylesterase [Parabacteroides johnsonii]|nr:sialate O-acetylesterase [Parabacteroides johnsonii]
MKRIVFFLMLYMFPCLCNAKVTLPSLIGDNMVLQRNTVVKLWGKATPYSTVKIKLSWDNQVYETKAEASGEWVQNVRTTDAGGPYSITISDGTPVVLSNILLGEVWICAGQSNMEMPVQGFFGQPCTDAVKTMRDARKYPDIRMFTVSRNSKKIPQNDCLGEWKFSDPGSVGAFSAVGYFFGRCLNQYLDIPVGLICTSWGGTNIEAWMSEESLKRISIDRRFIAENWTEEHSAPTVLYNGMVHPLLKYVAKGFIWYQGEANHRNFYDYKTMQVEMVRQWREAWNHAEMPFYYVQIAPYRYDDADCRAMALLRENQYKALDEIPYSGIVGTNDVGLYSIIHEPNKLVIGERLAYLALSRNYGIQSVPADMPTYKSVKIKERKAILSFNNLAAPDDQKDPRSFSWLDDDDKVITLKGFEIAGADQKFYPAKARLVWTENQIEVFADEVPEPIAVRYAFKNYSEANVKTTLGQPLAPFRTDNWDILPNELFKE